MKRYIIFIDGYLRANLDYLLSQIVHIRDLLNDRDDEVETWLHLPIVLLESMDQSCKFLPHYYEKPKVMNATCQPCAAFQSRIEEGALRSD